MFKLISLNECLGIGARHVQALMTFFSMVIIYAMRANLSVAIVAMTTAGEYKAHLEVTYSNHDNIRLPNEYMIQNQLHPKRFLNFFKIYI